ncbi:MAG: TadE/TadG family type IV pilus assembly protein [Actinomycetota bacterium]
MDERSFRGERGASAVEFAIVASLLFMILFGTIQFGIAFNQYQGVQAAAREGARTGSLPQATVDDIVTRVRDSVSIVDGSAIQVGCPGALAVGQGCVAITPTGSGAFQPCNLRTGQTVRVSVQYRALIQIPVWKSPAVTVTGDGEFRCE